MSGKAMQVFVSPGETALREMVTREESEGHYFWVAASLLHQEGAFAEPKVGAHVVESRKSVSALSG
jgi:hypothetical protein